MDRKIMFPTLFLSLFMFFSCTKEFPVNQQEEEEHFLPSVPQTLVNHFLAFKEEARNRNINIDYTSLGITAEIISLNQGNVAGVCSTNNRGLRHIIIDLDFWNRAPFYHREMIVFHELGHCILGRGHREDAFSNGICQSIMRSGNGGCRDAYRADTRDYFLDELFNKEFL
jgi:hypothetical protein